MPPRGGSSTFKNARARLESALIERVNFSPIICLSDEGETQQDAFLAPFSVKLR
jgi:hypothetical protein